MATRGFWNVRRGGKWYQIIYSNLAQIGSPGDRSIYGMLPYFRLGGSMPAYARRIPFPLPLNQHLSYVYTLDLDLASLIVSFWYRDEGDQDLGAIPDMRRLSLGSIDKSSDLRMEALLLNGSNPLLGTHMPAIQSVPKAEEEHEHWEIELGQPSSLNELQCRMFMDFVYQWRFFIDDHITWQYPSSTLFLRLCDAFLRLAAWDLEISSEPAMAKLPLAADFYPGWESPSTEAYWFHGFLVVLCQDLETSSSISAAVSRAREFMGRLGGRVDGVKCILISLHDIAFVQISADKIQRSTSFPLLTNTSATECSAGFRILTHFLTSASRHRNLAARETSDLALPTEILEMVLNSVAPYDIVSFAQGSFMIENWYYSSLPQLPGMAINRLDVSIPCCGSRDKSRGEQGAFCTACYTWRHSACLEPSECTAEDQFICSESCRQTGSRPRLSPGPIGRANRHGPRPEGCRVMHWRQEKVLQLRISAPTVTRPELRLMDRDLSSTPPNQIDYAVLFDGSWSGLAFGLDDVPI